MVLILFHILMNNSISKFNPVIILLMQPIVAVPSFVCADAFNKFLPFATGFAAGCMIWMVMAEVLPDGFKVTCLLSCLLKGPQIQRRVK